MLRRMSHRVIKLTCFFLVGYNETIAIPFFLFRYKVLFYHINQCQFNTSYCLHVVYASKENIACRHLHVRESLLQFIKTKIQMVQKLLQHVAEYFFVCLFIRIILFENSFKEVSDQPNN